MANKEQRDRIWRSVLEWNHWRQKHPETPVDLSETNLKGAFLREANLSMADLHWTNLDDTDLRRADLSGANLADANFRNAQLQEADLSRAILKGAVLNEAELSWADLRGADLTEAAMRNTILANVDLSATIGLHTVEHDGPSSLGIDTIHRSRGKIPEIFLRGVGVPEPFIANMSSLIAAMSPIEFYSCFISFSNRDREFAARLHNDLQNKGVRCWFAPEDLKIGDKMRPSFDEAIRVHDKVMVLLSESSVKSPWVEKEVETAFEKERQQNRTVLFPIRLDNAVMETQQAWAADIRRTRHIGDFCNWKVHDSYKKAFDRLLRDLKAESETESSK